MTFKITSNIDDIIKQLEDDLGSLDVNINDFLEDVMIDAVQMVKSEWPYATGTSKAGWSYRQKDNKVWVLFNNVEYTEFVHDGLAEDLVLEKVLKSINTLSKDRHYVTK